MRAPPPPMRKTHVTMEVPDNCRGALHVSPEERRVRVAGSKENHR
jgi:hypothetical protein